MTDTAVPLRTRELVHEPPVPGWSPRPPAAVLRRSRLEAYRLRRLARLERTRPTWYRRVVALQARSRQLWDRVLPRERVLAVTVGVLALTLFDAVATFVVVGSGVAVEANPLLAGLILDVGLGAAMGIRVVVGAVFTLALAWLSTWRREARPVLAFVAVVLAGVAVFHVAGVLSTLG